MTGAMGLPCTFAVFFLFTFLKTVACIPYLFVSQNMKQLLAASFPPHITGTSLMLTKPESQTAL